MKDMALRDEKPNRRIDVKGQICPYPLIETRETLKKMKPGQILEVITDHKPAALGTIPAFCEKLNYEFDYVEENGVWRVFIKKT
jgi:TusA-related sulfurtransferase